MYQGFQHHPLSDEHGFWTGRLPEELHFDAQEFEALWDLHPSDYHVIRMHGRPVKTPRWQQAYGEDYEYTGRVNRALPIPEALVPMLDWCRAIMDPRLNGILLNWYDGHLNHYIGKHRDSTKNIVHGAPIVTVSLGDVRIFRLRPWKAQGFKDFVADDGAVFVMPYATNLAWTHEVPVSRRHEDRRISATLRAFGTAGPEAAG